MSTYPWYDEATNGVRFNDLLATLKTLPARSIVLLHPCCHNPTGADLTNDQWDAVIEILNPASLFHSSILPIKDLVPVWKRMPTRSAPLPALDYPLW